MPRPDRLGARCDRAADRGRSDGCRARRRGIDCLASAGGSHRPVPGDGNGAPGPVRGRLEAGAAGRIMRRSPDTLLGDDPVAIMDALKAAVRAGAAPTDLAAPLPTRRRSGWLASAAPTSTADWETAHHVFTYANAVHQMAKTDRDRRLGPPRRGVRSILHGAMALYLARYLNVPPARIPGDERRPPRRSAHRCRGTSSRSARRLRPAAAGRPRGATRGTPSHTRPPAARRLSPRWAGRCCARTRAFTPIRCWRPACASSGNGATPTRAGTS